MARTIKDTALSSREARQRLKPRKKPYWRQIELGRHIGYYRGSRAGSWTARLYSEGRYHEFKLGAADDTLDPDGLSVLSFGQAQELARAWFASKGRQLLGMEPASTGPVTVSALLDSYLDWYAAHRKALGPTKRAIERHIRPALGEIAVDRLTTARIAEWHHRLATAPAMLRTARRAKAPNTRPAVNNEAKRQRKATANRVLTILKAALNHAWRAGRVADDTAWRKVRPFRDVDAPVIRYLSVAEARRLVNACPPDFKKMVQAALLTGCRYGELSALRASDFSEDAGRLLIRTGKSGKPRHTVLTIEAQRFFAEATTGKTSGAILFTRKDGKPWGPVHQIRPMRDACKAAKIAPAVSFHVLRHTHASLLAMEGVPLAVIAEQMGHADTRMTERHYAHLSPNYVADTIRQNFPNLGIVAESDVARLKAPIRRASRT